MRLFRYFVAVVTVLLLASLPTESSAQKASPSTDSNGIILGDISARSALSLNGIWRVIVDPYNTGFGQHWELDEKAATPRDLIEYNFDEAETLTVPGDWNSQRPELFYYEGTVWYRKLFEWKPTDAKRAFLHFGAVSKVADVYLNGKQVGHHEGDSTPFEFEVTGLLRTGSNSLVVAVNNQRRKESIPSLNSDWWNWGGIVREVSLVELPAVFVENYKLQLAPKSTTTLSGWVQLNGAKAGVAVKASIPEAGLSATAITDANGRAEITLKAPQELWSPEHPKLYSVQVTAAEDTLQDEVGFRSIRVQGSQILLNDKPIFLRGICMHEEAPFRGGRAYSLEDERTLFGWIQQLNANFVRLAHYPHNENAARLADKLGILLWEEIPVYWDNDWTNPATLQNAEEQLGALISRDQNRASAILWSLSNETKPGTERNAFLHQFAEYGRTLDTTRLFTSALNYTTKTGPHEHTLEDPFIADIDVIGMNEYTGWYGGNDDSIDQATYRNPSGKPLILSEFGGGAQAGLHGPVDHRWNEEFQANLYRHQLPMISRIPTIAGISPWILMDFRSPRRNLPGIQDQHNRKGLVSDRGEKKLAFGFLAEYYRKKAAEPVN